MYVKVTLLMTSSASNNTIYSSSNCLQRIPKNREDARPPVPPLNPPLAGVQDSSGSCISLTDCVSKIKTIRTQ